MRKLVLLFALCAGCANQAMLPWRVAQTEDPRAVAGCEFLGLVHGRGPAVTGLEPSDVVGAHNAAMNEASALGASHLLWQTVDEAEAAGSAYRCP